MGSLEDEEDPVVERAFAPHFWIGPARFDSDVLQVEDKPPDFLDKVVIGPAGVPGVLFSCSKCDGIVAGRLMTITSGDSSCPHCGQNVNIAESDPSLEELIKAFIYLGEVRTKDEPELALAFAREVLEVEHSIAAAHNIAGIVYDERGEKEQAIDHFRHAAELDPSRARYHYELGVALLTGEEVNGARREFERALELFPDYLYALNNLVQCYFLIEDWVAVIIASLRLKEMDADGRFALNAGAMMVSVHRELEKTASSRPRRPLWRRPLWTRLTGKLSSSYKDEVWSRLRNNSYGHIESFLEAFELQAQHEHIEAGDIFSVLRSLLPEDSAGYCLVCEYEAVSYLVLDRHVAAYRLSQQARKGLPCVSALVNYPRIAKTLPSLTAEVIRLYARLIEQLFGVKFSSGFEVVETQKSGRVRTAIELGLETEGNHFRIRRAGNILRITTPTREEVEHRIREDNYLALSSL